MPNHMSTWSLASLQLTIFPPYTLHWSWCEVTPTRTPHPVGIWVPTSDIPVCIKISSSIRSVASLQHTIFSPLYFTNTFSLGPTQEHNPNGISISSAVLGWLTVDSQTDRRTDRQTKIFKHLVSTRARCVGFFCNYCRGNVLHTWPVKGCLKSEKV